MDIEWIRNKVTEGQYLWTLHADEERRNDGLDVVDVETALLEGRIIESYPADRRGVSCLVYGESRSKPIHIVCGKNRTGQLIIITVYSPALPKWQSPTERSPK